MKHWTALLACLLLTLVLSSRANAQLVSCPAEMKECTVFYGAITRSCYQLPLTDRNSEEQNLSYRQAF